MTAEPQPDVPPRHFGTGWISGTLAVALGGIGLGAVLCLHFPEYLTIPEARAVYPLAILRAVIYVILVSAFALGMVSIMLRHNRSLGLIGIGLVLVAALLGGSKVPIDGAWDKKDVYLGLDYGLLVLIVYSLVFIPLEKLFGRLHQDVFRKGWSVDLTYFFVSALLVQLTAYLTLQPAFVLFGWAVNANVQNWVRAQPQWLQFLEIMILADLVQYWVHRLFHEIPWLWKFHAVHHSAEVMDWMAGNRLHLVDLAFTRSLIYVPSYVLGFDQGPLIAYIIFVAVYSVFIHANLRWTFGPLRYLFATPQFHHWHHGAEREAIDKNFAIHLPVLDVLFGTFHLPGDRWPAYYGVHSNDVPNTYLGQWLYPFLPRKKQTATLHPETQPADAKERLKPEGDAMSEVRLVVREAGRDWSGTVHASLADCAIAALSADPTTLSELETACCRFHKPDPDYRFFANLSAGQCTEPYDAGLVVIDLVARLVAVDSTYSSPGPTGRVDYHNGHRRTDVPLSYHLADDWLFVRDPYQWSGFANQRRRERAARPTFDTRAVFYGRPLLEYIARETFAAHARQEPMDTAAADAIKAIHAAWLLTPREDLGGVCPRDTAWEQHDHLKWDLQDQAQRWSRLQQCPPGLDESSFAFRYGGFGTHELVEYYELVRELLWSCWERFDEVRIKQPHAVGAESFTVGDFLTSEVPRLEHIRDAWLDGPNPEFHGRTPRSIINRERARLPEGMTGRDAIIDPDCPCCQMQADLPGPVFWHLDGCNMDEDFAFDIYHRTREEWETQRREWEENCRRFEAEWAERKRLGVTEAGCGNGEKDPVWTSSFSVGDAADVPLGVRLFGIGGHLAELIVNLRGKTGDQSATADAQGFIDQLNRDFGNLRELLQNSEPTLAMAILEPVTARFAETLADVASARPDLSEKCRSLADSLLRFQSPDPWDLLEGDGTNDIPY